MCYISKSQRINNEARLTFVKKMQHRWPNRALIDLVDENDHGVEKPIYRDLSWFGLSLGDIIETLDKVQPKSNVDETWIHNRYIRVQVSPLNMSTF